MENLWTTRAKPVEHLRPKIFLADAPVETFRRMGCGRRLRVALRLIAAPERVRFALAVFSRRTDIHVTVHRFEETIGGRAYQIEVTAVSNRWRAQLRRTARVPTAMMPFYGPTPAEAARQLAQWLTLAHARMAPAATPAIR